MNVFLSRLNIQKMQRPTWGWAARAAWTIYAMILIVLTVPGLGLAFRALETPCNGATCIDGQITQEGAALLQSQQISMQEYALLTFAPTIAILLVTLALSAILIWKRGREPYAVLVSFILVALGASLTRGSTALSQGSAQLLFLSNVIWYIQGAGFIVGLCLFPDGTLAPRWSRWLILGWPLLHIPVTFFPTLFWQRVFMFAFPAALITSVGIQIYRYRKVYSPVQRQQAKWALLGFGLVISCQVAVLPLALLFPSVIQPGTLPSLASNLVIQLAMLISLVMLAIAVLRYHLFDIDLLINRTLVYGALAVVTISIYFAVILLLNWVLSERSSALAAFLAAGVVAFGFQPIRLAIQSAVNRLMFGQRDDPYAVLSYLGQQIETTLQPVNAMPVMVETIACSLRLPYAAVSLNQDGKQQMAAVWGNEQPNTIQIPLVYANQRIGALIVAERKPGEGFNMADRHLFRDLAPHVASAAHALLLSTDLERSRLEAVTAREEARRRLGGDLHDGVVQRLTGLLRRIEVMENTLKQDPPAAQLRISEIKSEAHAIIDEIRQLAYTLHPSDLELLGLLGALRERITQVNDSSAAGLKVEFHTEGSFEALPAAIETAIYYITLEALTNVQRHSEACHCSISLQQTVPDAGQFPMFARQMLTLEIMDDGKGLELPSRSLTKSAEPGGLGMITMQARAAEVGGTCQVESRPGQGTRILVRIPLLTDE